MTTVGHPLPQYWHHVYGVHLTDIGEEGGFLADGHVPLPRFAAACKHMGRREFGWRNAADDTTFTLADFAGDTRQAWAVPDVAEEGGWRITWSGVTERTPGALAVTLYWP